MHTFSIKQQIVIAAGLALVMAVTRSPQIPGADLLHGASWAVFFAVGVYLSSAIALPVFLGLAFVLDAMAIGWAGVSAYCFTPAYAMLIPAYGCLWAGGRWYAARHRFAWATLLPLAISAGVAAVVCELFSSGGFYWLSGNFADPSLTEFALREARYFPAYVAMMFFWLGLMTLVHGGLATIRTRDQATGDSAS